MHPADGQSGVSLLTCRVTDFSRLPLIPPRHVKIFVQHAGAIKHTFYHKDSNTCRGSGTSNTLAVDSKPAALSFHTATNAKFSLRPEEQHSLTSDPQGPNPLRSTFSASPLRHVFRSPISFPQVIPFIACFSPNTLFFFFFSTKVFPNAMTFEIPVN